MQYETIDGKDFLLYEGSRFEIGRLVFTDPQDAGFEIFDLMIGCVANREPTFSIVDIEGRHLTLLSFDSQDDDNHVVQLGEVRTDGNGMLLENDIPRVKGNAILPIAQLVGNNISAQIISFENCTPHSKTVQQVNSALQIRFQEKQSTKH